MTISVVGVGNAAGESAGTTTTASTVSVTPTRNAASASGDRVYVVVGANNTSGTTPTNWTAVLKDTAIASSLGAAAAGAGQRFVSIYWRDYDGLWAMPAFTLTSAAQNTQTVGCITLRKDATDIWNTPTVSGVGNYAGTAGTAFSAATAAFGTTASNVGQQFNLLLACSVFNDNVTMTGGTLTGVNGFTSSTVTEQVDGGNATGNDVALKVHTCPPSASAEPAGALTHAGTLSAASQGGFVVVEQTVSPPKMETMSDNFNAGFPGSLWLNLGVGGVPEAGAVRVAHGVGPDYQSFTSIPFRSLVNSYAYVQIKDFGNQSGLATHYVLFKVASADQATDHSLWCYSKGNLLKIYKMVAGAISQVGADIPLDTRMHAFQRIREAGGTIFWDSSHDGRVWANLQSAPAPFPVIAMAPACECSVDVTEASGSSALFDNFNTSTAEGFNEQLTVAVKRAAFY